MKQLSVNTIISSLSLVFFLSCSSDLDFDQINDLKLKPVVVANLAYFDVRANQLLDNGGTHVLYDTREFDVFKDKFFTNDLLKAEFDFEVENTINRAFTLNQRLINANGDILETISYPVPAYTGSSNVIKYPTEVFENQRLELLKQTAKIDFELIIAAGPPLNAGSTGSIKLRSSATVYLEFE
ncbi:hypothetical protein [Flavobacterium reichenbachii]|uniref:Uncharacterized protein n=1 Tax=Flavobacterium reichenbachii TaxID=362418 RepID=A0A085ZP32_9FLAO|nr:hypothetical protein [Flavobacterium reichenbachii]KFF06196.1 hypothetical protein IW19_11935 [Flavobacterium reichenbachii]OXB17581.1 hypothetical protein B0A68_04635 [Flavobacterium reichenbachii]